MDLNYIRNKFKLVGQYKVSNPIEEDIRMKFDVVIGNPPYQDTKEDGSRKSKAVNLWSKFVSLAMNISKDNGKVAMVTPNSWLSPSVDLAGQYKIDGKERFWDVFNSYSTYANVNDVAQHFKGVGSTFGYFIVDKSKHDGLKFSDGADTSLGFLPKSGIEECVKQLSTTGNLSDTYRMDRSNRPGWRVSVPASRVLEANSIEILYDAGMPTAGSKKDETLYTYIYCNTKKECVEVRQRILECLDILNTHCRWSGFINNQTLKMIKL